MPSRGFRVSRPTVIFRHFGRFAPYLLLICIPDILSDMSATNLELVRDLQRRGACLILLKPNSKEMTKKLEAHTDSLRSQKSAIIILSPYYFKFLFNTLISNRLTVSISSALLVATNNVRLARASLLIMGCP